MNHTLQFEQWMEARRQQVENRLDQQLHPSRDSFPQTSLLEAMRYSTLGGGKRLRAMLVYATGEAMGADLGQLDFVACAVELIHSYSLIHDDMPAMDDDDLRRGKPSCHKTFGEATALLAGDALQSLAFEVLSQCQNAPHHRVEMINILAKQIGFLGMAGGQAIDLNYVGMNIDLNTIETMHQLKTAALIKASLLLAAHCAESDDTEIYKQLSDYGDTLGLAFQVQDDILDLTSKTEVLGKPQGADRERSKPTYVSLLGLGAAQEKSRQLIASTEIMLRNLPIDTRLLSALSNYVIQRRH